MKPLVIYHDKCTDGFGAAFAAWLKLGDEAEYLPMDYGEKTPLDPSKIQYEDREVYVLDFSFPRDVMDRLFSAAKRVVWLDHHKTAFELWCGKAPDVFFTKFEPTPGTRHTKENYVLLDDCKSGALLAWEYFHPGQDVPMFIQHIDDRDRWQWKLEGSAEFHAAMQIYQPWTFEQWRDIHIEDLDPGEGIFVEAYNSFLYTEGKAILRAQKHHVERIASQAVKCTVVVNKGIVDVPQGETYDLAEYTGLAVNTPIFQSEVGHELANTSGSFGLSWYMADVGRARCSFRSNGDYDVSAIARSLGGGGHKNAAGCEVSVETLLGWLK